MFGKDGVVGGRKNDAPTVQKRVNEVEAALMDGSWCLRKQKEIADKYRVSVRQVELDAQQVRERWKEESLLADPLAAKSTLLMRALSLEEGARKDRNYSAAIRILEFAAKVYGAFEPSRVDVTHTVAQLSVDDLRYKLAELDQKTRRVLDVEPVGVPVPALPAPVEVVEIPEERDAD